MTPILAMVAAHHSTRPERAVTLSVDVIGARRRAGVGERTELPAAEAYDWERHEAQHRQPPATLKRRIVGPGGLVTVRTRRQAS